jgi:DNA-binding transcriptional ArsR family regulator
MKYEMENDMEKLRPTLWRTCRVLSNETRLKLLWRLMQDGEMSMGRLGASLGLSGPSASVHLRALNARGLLKVERRGLYAFYSLGANNDVEHASELVAALHVCHGNAMSYSEVMRLTTAFTHPRRITIVQALSAGGLDEVCLARTTEISPQALCRHVKKLVDRGYVKENDEMVVLKEQHLTLGQTLLKAALG